MKQTIELERVTGAVTEKVAMSMGRQKTYWAGKIARRAHRISQRVPCGIFE